MRAPASDLEGAVVDRPLTLLRRPVLVVDDLVVRYGRLAAVDRLTLGVTPGRVVGLVGPNGSGKTTALMAVAGLQAFSEGEVTIAGERAGTLAARRSLALVPDEPTGLDDLSVAELAALVRSLYAAGEAAALRASVLIEAFGLGPLESVRLGALSHGRRRQASLVAALSLAPPLLLLDEATDALDPEAVVVLREALRVLSARGSGVLLATQDLHFAETACDEVVMLRAGAVVASGTVREILEAFDASTLEGAFLSALVEPDLRGKLRRGLDAL